MNFEDVLKSLSQQWSQMPETVTRTDEETRVLIDRMKSLNAEIVALRLRLMDLFDLNFNLLRFGGRPTGHMQTSVDEVITSIFTKQEEAAAVYAQILATRPK